MKNLVFKETSQIDQYSQYCSSPEFQRLCNYLFEKRIKIESQRRSLPWEIKTFEKMAWRPTDFTLNADQPDYSSQRKSFHPLGVAHHALHYFLAERYQQKLKNRPLVTLLCESIASNFDLYLAVYFYNEKKGRHPLPPLLIQSCQRYWTVRTHDLQSLFRKYRNNPFKIYKTVSLEMFEFLKLALQWCTTETPSALQLRSFKKRLEKFKYRYLFYQYDNDQFIFYTLALCTAQSDRMDLKKVDELETYFRQSKNMDEFLDRLNL